MWNSIARERAGVLRKYVAICVRVLWPLLGIAKLGKGKLGSFIVDKNYDMQGMVREFYHRFDQDEFVAPASEAASVERYRT